MASDLKENIQKSRYFPYSNISTPKVHKFESIMEFQHTYNLCRYLDFPMLTGKVRNSNFDYILDKTHTHLAG